MKSSKVFHLAVVALMSVLLLTSGCKSKKLAMEAAAKEKAQKEEALRKQKEEEEMKRKEAEARVLKEQEEEAKRLADAKKQAELAPSVERVEQYFASISNAASVTSANSSISEALTMFSSEQATVLIVISEEGGEKDYDKPTNIKTYLNYLKDQKKNINRVSNIVLDSSGKIKELELKKQ